MNAGPADPAPANFGSGGRPARALGLALRGKRAQVGSASLPRQYGRMSVADPAQSKTSGESGAMRAARPKRVPMTGTARDLFERGDDFGDGRRGHDLAIRARTQQRFERS